MIRIMFIIPYVEMEQQISEIIRVFPCEEEIRYQCALYTCVDLNDYKQEWPCDVIIARGYSADVITAQYATKIPVIKINFTSSDAIRSIQICREQFYSKKIAIIGHPSLANAAEEINKISDIPIDIYTLDGPTADISAAVHAALKNGNDTIIGGGTACQYAKSLNVNSFNSFSSYESLYHAITNAIQTVQIQRQERIKTQTLQTVMDHIGEGVLLTDINGSIKVCNQFVGGLLGTSGDNLIGKNIVEVFPAIFESFQVVLKTHEQVKNDIVRRAGKRYMVNLIPVVIEQTIDCVSINFHDISNIQEMETQIRKKLHTKGMVAKYQFDDIIYKSEQMKRLLESAKEFAAVDSNILILGESGTGKELFAQSIHAASQRENRPFVAVNCSAIPDQLLESEMFGYVGGSFTGSAKEGKQGLFELAHNGTLFLDEVAELPYSFQSKLLRVLQEREIRRIGDDKVIPVNVRIIAATNQNLEKMINNNTFRRDLYFRLNVLCLFVPPLRQRTEDILPLFQCFLDTYSVKFQKNIPKLPQATQDILRQHEWLGNIRELRNVAERFMVLHTEARDITTTLEMSLFPHHQTGLAPTLNAEDPERARIRQVLLEAGSRDDAAARLGISRSTLWRKMKQHNLI